MELLIPLAAPDALIDLSRQVLLGDTPELLVIHHPVEYLIVALHALDEQVIEDATEIGREVRWRISLGRFNDLLVSFGRRPDLIEEELIGLGEVRSKPLVELSAVPGGSGIFSVSRSSLSGSGRPLPSRQISASGSRSPRAAKIAFLIGAGSFSPARLATTSTSASKRSRSL